MNYDYDYEYYRHRVNKIHISSDTSSDAFSDHHGSGLDVGHGDGRLAKGNNCMCTVCVD